MTVVQNCRVLPGVNLRRRTGVRVGQTLPTSAPTPTPAKMVDPIDANPSLDSDSAALVTIHSLFQPFIHSFIHPLFQPPLARHSSDSPILSATHYQARPHIRSQARRPTH